MTQRIEDLYYFYAAKHIHDTVDAFIVLRGQHRVDGARFVVRPALETMLRLRAVRAKPHLLYRVLIAENNELDKWFFRCSSTSQLTLYPHFSTAGMASR